MVPTIPCQASYRRSISPFYSNIPESTDVTITKFNNKEPIAFTEGRSFTCLGLKTKNAHETDFFLCAGFSVCELAGWNDLPGSWYTFDGSRALKGDAAMVLGCRDGKQRYRFCEIFVLLTRSVELPTTLCESFLAAYDCYLPHSTPSPTPYEACLDLGGYDVRNCRRLQLECKRSVDGGCLSQYASVNSIPTIATPKRRSVARFGHLLRSAENADGQSEGTPEPLSMIHQAWTPAPC